MSRYLQQFRYGAEEAKAAFELYGDCILVEKVKEPEAKMGSFFIATASTHRDTFAQDRPHFVHVLAVGEGYYDDATGKSVGLSVEVGDIILVGALSVKYFSMFGSLEGYEPDSIGITREAEIQLRFKGESGYEAFFAGLNKHTPKKMGDQ